MKPQEPIQPENKYFERQSSYSLQCGMHSINNLFKNRVYKVNEMVEICYELSDDFINPHKHIFGGDYDANVIIMALQKKGYQCQWLDKRKQIKLEEMLQNGKKQTLGFLINIIMPRRLYHVIFRFSSRHWYSVRLADQKGFFEICDSLQEQIVQKDRKKLAQYLKGIIAQDGGQIFWVYIEAKQN